LGIGIWELGIAPNPQSPIPNPQSPIPNPQLIQLINVFVERKKNNLEIVKKNIILFKNICIEGIDEIKDKISIENMMLDENIFLSFDKKFKDIDKEKDKISKDIETYKLFKNELKILITSVEKIYNELYTFLDKYSTSDIYEKISKEINNDKILPINSRNILHQLFSDIKQN